MDAQRLFQSALNAEDVREEERLWTAIIDKLSGARDAPWRDDTLARVFGNRGNARGRQGKLQEALSDYEKAQARVRGGWRRLRTPPPRPRGRPRPHTRRTLAVSRRAVVPCWSPPQELAPYAVDPVLNHGVVLEQLGRFEESIADCARPGRLLSRPLNLPRPAAEPPPARPRVRPSADKEVLRASPDDPAAHNNLGNSLMGLRRYPEAVASYSRAVELAPQFSFAQCNRAIALFAGAFGGGVRRALSLESERERWRDAVSLTGSRAPGAPRRRREAERGGAGVAGAAAALPGLHGRPGGARGGAVGGGASGAGGDGVAAGGRPSVPGARGRALRCVVPRRAQISSHD